MGKRLFAVVFTLLLFGGVVRAQRVSLSFKALQFTYDVSLFADFTTTQIALHSQRYVEKNPLASLHVRSVPLSFVCYTGAAVAGDLLFPVLYRESKTLAYVLVAALVVVRGYAIYHNIREMQR